MPDNISKQTLIALLPPGSLWIPADDEDFDKLLDGMAANIEIMREAGDSLAFIRDPQLTPVLDDLEKEFGLAFDPSLTDQERRNRALSAKTANKGDGTDTFLQTKLQESGFDLQVHSNDPPIDPDLILDNGFTAYCGFDTSVCGNDNAVCGQDASSLVVNGIFDDTFLIPVSSDYFHLIFFVGGDAVRNGVTDEIESISAGQVPISRQSELTRLIVKYKPLHCWCGLIVDFI